MNAHAPAAVCQPSRYALLSGTYGMRAQRKGNYQLYFHEGQVTLPSLLRSAGYRTGCFGKWHNGFGRGAEPDYNADLKPGPLEIGFDHFFGTPRSHNEPPFVFVENHRVVGLDPADPIRIIPHEEVVRRGLKDPVVANHLKGFKVSEAELIQKGLKDWGWGASEGAAAAHAARPHDRIDLIVADKAVEFIKQNKERPFFAYVPFNAPHVPIYPAKEFQGTSQAGSYGDFIHHLDACVGKILEVLKAERLSDNTLVLFTSDNGGLFLGDAIESGHHPNGSLLGQKTDGWEGGHRVPFIARWPGRIPAGTQARQILGLTDVMATVAAAAKIPLPAGAAPDSLDQLSVLTDPTEAPSVRTELIAQGTGGYVLRQGDWVYIPKVETLEPKDISSVFWPLAGLYSSTDQEIVRWHIRLAKAAGIDAFLVDWWGPNNWGLVPGLTLNAFENAVLPIAAEEGFKVALLDEPINFRPLHESQEWAATYLKKYKDHPAYLKIDGKPVYYVYQVPFNPGLKPEKFAELRAYVEERVGPVYWIVDAIANTDDNFRIPEPWRPVEGIGSFSFYGTFSIFHAHTYGQLAERYARVVKQAHESGKRMLVPVHPGHDNLKEGNPRHYEMPRRDGETFRDYLRAATDAGADYVMVTSFNEWPESTVIEPSSCWEDPYQYLKILAEWKGVTFKQPEEPERIQTTAK